MQVVKNKINNLYVNLIKTNKFKFVTIRMSFLSPLDYEDIASYNVLVKMLTTRNQKYPSINQFNSYLENKYGMIISGGYSNRGNVGVFNIVSSSMNSKFAINENLLKEQIEMIKECLFEPILTQEVLDEIKTVYIEKLKERLDKKTYILKKNVHSIFGENNPYGVNIEGNIESISQVTLEKVISVYKKLISSDCRVYVCGEVDEAQLSYFEGFNLKSNDENYLDMGYLKPIEKREIDVFESSFLQSAISIIYECDIIYNDSLYYALKIFLEMFNYDLFNIIREKYNFCYYIYAMSNNYLNTIEIVSEIESKNLNQIVDIIEDILKGYKENINKEQFELSKNKIFTALKTSKESASDLVDLYFSFDFNKSVASYDEFYSNYESVTLDMIKEVVNKLSLKRVSILKEGINNG